MADVIASTRLAVLAVLPASRAGAIIVREDGDRRFVLNCRERLSHGLRYGRMGGSI